MTRIRALTSLSPVNHDRQRAAVRSWRAADLKILSFNHPSEIDALKGVYKHVSFVPVEETSHGLFGKHYVPIHAMCRWAASTDVPVLIINADIELPHVAVRAEADPPDGGHWNLFLRSPELRHGSRHFCT